MRLKNSTKTVPDKKLDVGNKWAVKDEYLIEKISSSTETTKPPPNDALDTILPQEK